MKQTESPREYSTTNRHAATDQVDVTKGNADGHDDEEAEGDDERWICDSASGEITGSEKT